MSLRADRKALDILAEHATPGSLHRVFHYFYFDNENAAAPLVAWLRTEGFEIAEHNAASGSQWLVLACHNIAPTEEAMANARSILQDQASNAGGEYDGWEVEILAN